MSSGLGVNLLEYIIKIFGIQQIEARLEQIQSIWRPGNNLLKDIFNQIQFKDFNETDIATSMLPFIFDDIQPIKLVCSVYEVVRNRVLSSKFTEDNLIELDFYLDK